MCPRWRASFASFLDDMGECPSGHELDRIDNDGNYEPGNCRWVTRSENMFNRKRAIPLPPRKRLRPSQADVARLERIKKIEARLEKRIEVLRDAIAVYEEDKRQAIATIAARMHPQFAPKGFDEAPEMVPGREALISTRQIKTKTT